MKGILGRLKTRKQKHEQITAIQNKLADPSSSSGGSIKVVLIQPLGGPSLLKRSVRIGNLHPHSNSNDIIRVFKSCGNIVRATVLRTRDGDSKGSAYIEFEDESGVENALQIEDVTLFERRLTVCLQIAP